MLRERIHGLQTFVRGFIARRNFKNLVQSVESIQAVFRMVIALQQVGPLCCS
jgi:hypothetical protein